MRIAISGGSGFVGGYLRAALSARGDDVTLLVRAETRGLPTGLRTARIDEPGALDGVEAIVNLAGAGVLDERWSDARLRVVRESRTLTTRALALAAKDARVFVSASAIGYYGMRSDDADLDESSPPGDDVLARICVDWEEEARRAQCRVALARIGIVLGPNGGALSRMLPMFRRFLGGPLGDGKQWWSWIHVDDVVGSILFALDTPSFEGAFNATTSTPARMNEVARMLGEVMHRPSAVRVPAFALRAALGGAADVLLTGARILPKKLTGAGYAFRYESLREALLSAARGSQRP